MNPPVLPLLDLVELHRIVLELQQTASVADRNRLANEIVGHSAIKPKLNCACCFLLKHLVYDLNLVDDVKQGAILILIERFIAGNLAYQDAGPDRFGGWLYRICFTAGADALITWQSGLQSIVLLESGQLEIYPAHAEIEHPVDQMLRMIAAIPDLEDREIMLESATGVAICDSARQHNLSDAAIFRKRHDGMLQIRRLFPEGLADMR